MTRNEILEILNKGPCNVSFNKVTGERRDMYCTLSKALIPAPKDVDTNNAFNTKKVREINENVVVAYDLNKNDWRSFRVENLISIEEA
jgi:hypothetical protein